jgi:calcineurin-like phosphoesterase
MSHKVYNPFLKIEEILLEYKKSDYDILIVEFHRETTAELYGMAHHLS